MEKLLRVKPFEWGKKSDKEGSQVPGSCCWKEKIIPQPLLL